MEHRRQIMNFFFGNSSSQRQNEDTDNEMDDIPPLEPLNNTHDNEPHQDVDMAPPESASLSSAPRRLRPTVEVEEVPDEDDDDVRQPASSSSASSVYTTPASELPTPPPMFHRSSTRRSRVEDDHDEERDRRHPSERVGVQGQSAADALRAALEVSSSDGGALFEAATSRAGDNNNDNNIASSNNSSAGRPFRFFQHYVPHGLGLSSASPLASPNPGSASAPATTSASPAPSASAAPNQHQHQPQPQSQPQQPQTQQPQQPQPQAAGAGANANGNPTPAELQAQLADVADIAARLVNNLLGGMAVHFDMNPPQAQGRQEQPQPQPQAQAEPQAAAGAANAPAPPQGENPEPAQRPVNYIPQLLARLAAASQGQGVAGVPLPFFFPFPFAHMEREVDDPERARAFIRGLEAVPEGLVRRLERVGKMSEAEEGGCGDGGCAVCWDRLLDDDGEEEGEKEEGGSHGSEEGDGEGEEGGEEKEEKEKEKEEPLPKIVALPCAHVFHSRCLIPWFSKPRQTTCPTCRFNIDPEGLMRRGGARAAPVDEVREIPVEVVDVAPGDGVGAQPAGGADALPAGQNPQPAPAAQGPAPGPFSRDFISVGFDIIIAGGPPPPGVGAGGMSMMFSLGPDGRINGGPFPANPMQNQGQPQQEQRRDDDEMNGEEEDGENAPQNGDELEEAAFERFVAGMRNVRNARNAGQSNNGGEDAAAPAPAGNPPPPSSANSATPPASAVAGPAPAPAPRRPRILNGGFSIPLGAAGPGVQVVTGAGRTMSEAIGALLGSLAGPQVPAQAPQPQERQEAAAPQADAPQPQAQPQPQPQPQREVAAPAEDANANPDAPPNGREARLRHIRNLLDVNTLLGIPVAPFASRPQHPARGKKAWTLPPAPGPTLRQRIERKEHEVGLRCSEISCGVGPSDDDPLVAVTEQGLKQLSIHDSGNNPVCPHTFHSSCLVTAERVALQGADVPMMGDNVEVSCPVCRGVGCMAKKDWDEGVQTLM